MPNIIINEKQQSKYDFKLTFENIYTGEKRYSYYTNAITNNCKIMIASKLAQGSDACDITYCAVGTGAFPANPSSSSDLVTELDRVAVDISSSGAIVSITGFFGASDAVGTLTEMGWFGGEGASAAADSGVMINHAAITEVKTSSEIMTVDGTITLS